MLQARIMAITSVATTVYSLSRLPLVTLCSSAQGAVNEPQPCSKVNGSVMPGHVAATSKACYAFILDSTNKLFSSLCCLDFMHDGMAAAADTSALKEDNKKDLWQSDWDDEDTTEDFQSKLRQELDRHMKD